MVHERPGHRRAGRQAHRDRGHTGIAVTPTDSIHIVYYDETNGGLMHAYRSLGGPFTIKAVATAGNVGDYASIASDAAGRLHVAYSGANIEYAYRCP